MDAALGEVSDTTIMILDAMSLRRAGILEPSGGLGPIQRIDAQIV